MVGKPASWSGLSAPTLFLRAVYRLLGPNAVEVPPPYDYILVCSDTGPYSLTVRLVLFCDRDLVWLSKLPADPLNYKVVCLRTPNLSSWMASLYVVNSFYDGATCTKKGSCLRCGNMLFVRVELEARACVSTVSEIGMNLA